MASSCALAHIHYPPNSDLLVSLDAPNQNVAIKILYTSCSRPPDLGPVLPPHSRLRRPRNHGFSRIRLGRGLDRYDQGSSSGDHVRSDYLSCLWGTIFLRRYSIRRFCEARNKCCCDGGECLSFAVSGHTVSLGGLFTGALEVLIHSTTKVAFLTSYG